VEDKEEHEMSGTGGVNGNGRKDPFGGSGAIPGVNGWGSFISKEYAEVTMSDLEASPDGLRPGAPKGGEAVEAALAAQREGMERVAQLKDSLPVVLDESLIERGIPPVLPKKLVKGLVDAVAEGAVGDPGYVDLARVRALRNRWSMRNHRDLLDSLLRLASNGDELIREGVFFLHLADAMRNDPLALVVRHLEKKGVKPYAAKDKLLPGVTGIVKAVGKSELGRWKKGEAWLVDLQSDIGAHEEPVMKALGKLAARGRYQPVNVFLDTYARAVKDSGPKLDKGPDYIRGIPTSYIERHGFPIGMTRQALPQAKSTFMQTLAKQVPAYLNLRLLRFA
jgi:hypothetical protein